MAGDAAKHYGGRFCRPRNQRDFSEGVGAEEGSGEGRPTLHLALKEDLTDVPAAALSGTPVLRGAVMSFRLQEAF